MSGDGCWVLGVETSEGVGGRVWGVGEKADLRKASAESRKVETHNHRHPTPDTLPSYTLPPTPYTLIYFA